jgi:hypothetical protein
MDKNTQYEYPSIHHRLIGYPYRVWIFTFIICPLIIIAWELISEKEYPTTWTIVQYFLDIAFLIALSAPSMFFYMLVFWRLTTARLRPIFIKLLLFTAGVTGVLVTGFFLSGSSLFIFSFNGFSVEFFFVFLILSLCFSLKEK